MVFVTSFSWVMIRSTNLVSTVFTSRSTYRISCSLTTFSTLMSSVLVVSTLPSLCLTVCSSRWMLFFSWEICASMVRFCSTSSWSFFSFTFSTTTCFSTNCTFSTTFSGTV